MIGAMLLYMGAVVAMVYFIQTQPWWAMPFIIVRMGSANERRRSIVTPSLIDLANTRNYQSNDVI